MDDPTLKPKEDRVREGITILNKLKEVGFSKNDSAFAEIQSAISVWVKTGDKSEKKFPIPRYGRMAILTLPSKRLDTATLVLKNIT